MTPALIFLHHFGGSARSWEGVIARLQDRFHCFALDLRGYGANRNHPGPFAIADLADDATKIARKQGLESYWLIGHSMGGKVALAAATRRPRGLRGLLLLAPSPPSPEPIPPALRERLLAGWGDRALAEEVLDRATATRLPDQARERALMDMLGCGSEAWRSWLLHGSREDLRPAPGAVVGPVHVLSGELDETIPSELLQRELVNRLDEADLTILPGAGHLLPMEASEAVAAFITAHAVFACAETLAPAIRAQVPSRATERRIDCSLTRT